MTIEMDDSMFLDGSWIVEAYNMEGEGDDRVEYLAAWAQGLSKNHAHRMFKEWVRTGEYGHVHARPMTTDELGHPDALLLEEDYV